MSIGPRGPARTGSPSSGRRAARRSCGGPRRPSRHARAAGAPSPRTRARSAAPTPGKRDVRAADVVVDEVGAEQAQRREVPRMGRDDDAPDMHQVERRREEHRPGRAVGDQSEVARVSPAPEDDVRHLLGDVRGRDPEREADALLERERRLERQERAQSELRVEPQRTGRKALGVENAHQQRSVGHGRLRTAAAVAAGPGSEPALAARRARLRKQRSRRCCRRRRRRWRSRSRAR